MPPTAPLAAAAAAAAAAAPVPRALCAPWQVALLGVRGGAEACAAALEALRRDGMALLAAARAPPQALPAPLAALFGGWVTEEGTPPDQLPGKGGAASQPVVLLLVGREGAGVRAERAAHAAPATTRAVFPVAAECLEMLLAPPALGAGHVTQAGLGATVDMYSHARFLLRAGLL